jgi:CRISPR system Cascade subunit CasD
MTSSLTLCIDAPMQSWGTTSRFIIRDTATEPTKSGIVGLLAAALGVARDDTEKIAQLAELRMGVRVDREGIIERDYHTTQNVPTTLGGGHRTIVSNRYYLADGVFLIVLEGEPSLLAQLHAAVQHPHWPLFFGRKAYVPTRPLLGSGRDSEPLTAIGLIHKPLDIVLTEHPWLEIGPDKRRREARAIERGVAVALRTLVDCHATSPGAEPRRDHPVSFARDNRRFVTRSVCPGQVPLTTTMIFTGEPACS